MARRIAELKLPAFPARRAAPRRGKVAVCTSEDDAAVARSRIAGNNRASPMPPLDLVSGSHPDQARWYNDGLGDWFLAWSRPYQSLAGYYWRLSTSESTLPSAAAGNGSLIMAESIQVPAAQLTQGMNYVHIVSVDSAFNVGTVKDGKYVTAADGVAVPTIEKW